MKISVIIVTHNRKEELKNTIQAFLNQKYENKEIIVIDNCSQDGTKEEIPILYPNIAYYWLPENFDIRSFNIGLQYATGEIIWRTDDDSYPHQTDTFDRIIEILSKYPEIDIIALEQLLANRNNKPWEWYPYKIDKTNVPPDGYKSNYFCGCGAVIRRKVFDTIGGFWEFGFEELDFCTRAIMAGFNIRYYPNLAFLHFATPVARQNADRWIQLSKQYIRYNWRYFPLIRAFGRSILLFIFQSMVALSSRVGIKAYFEGILSMKAVSLHTIRKERNPVPKDKIKDITLGTSLFKSQMKYFKNAIQNRLRRNGK